MSAELEGSCCFRLGELQASSGFSLPWPSKQWLVQRWSILPHGGHSQHPYPYPASCDSSLQPLTHSFIHLLSHSFAVPGEPGTQPALVPRDPGLTFQSTGILTRFCLVGKSPWSLSSTGHSVWASHIVIPSANLYGVAQGSANYSPGPKSCLPPMVVKPVR